MWIAGGWSDYELLECSGGERLERWGGYTLVRPDPQVIWDTPRRHGGWRKPDARYERSASGGGRWLPNSLPDRWTVGHGDLRFHVGLTGFKHTGLFPEQSPNWRFIRDAIKDSARAVNVLNLFAYTGAASIAAAASGNAKVTHVDAAKGMVRWARDNAALTRGNAALFADDAIRWIVDDCEGFVARERRRGKRYDALILDPPSFGRGPDGKTWRLEDGLYRLLTLCACVLSEKPLFVLLNTYTTGLSAGVMAHMLECVFGPAFANKAEARELGIPITAGGVLSGGASARIYN
ncbi:MAG: class I SAM-dependent methyltransferase [Oscillospiraceae bacterium]|nr:class I SAM-dependent methyltransferase [Oscillospiraceae bacterium]